LSHRREFIRHRYDGWEHLNVTETLVGGRLRDASSPFARCGVPHAIVARVSLDRLRSRKSRREEPLDSEPSRAAAGSAIDPEEEAVLADSVGLALLVVLDTLDPAERLAFVLHDLFVTPFEAIASIVGRSPTATRQLASRARRRVRAGTAAKRADLRRQREVVEAFPAAARAGDFEGLLAILDPDVVRRADSTAAGGAPRELRGTQAGGPGERSQDRNDRGRPRSRLCSLTEGRSRGRAARARVDGHRVRDPRPQDRRDRPDR
jgi:hypothetical protein